IDHITRYPYDMDNPILVEYLAIFNRIVGSADEMGTFLKKMKKEVTFQKAGDQERRELDIKFR
ncbi:MAG: GTP pyrophosphokinase, partial [Fusobacteriaceae bacterium]